jgi:thioredoxin reductase
MPAATVDHRNIILGAGPAGLQLAALFERRQEPYVVLERGARAGNFFEAYPRHGKLLSINKRFTGCPDLESRLRYDWNSLISDDASLQFSSFSDDYFPDRDALVRYLDDFARKCDLRVRYGAAVDRVSRDGDGYRLTLADGEALCCRRLFVATGVSRERHVDIEGAALCERYGQASTDPLDYQDQRVMIVGKGNSAFETADNLIGVTRKLWICGKSTVRLAWASHYVGDLRAVNNGFLDTYQLKAQNNILDGELTAVSRNDDELVATLWFASRQRSYSFACDRVILCTGFCFDDAIFEDDCKPRLCCGDKVPAMTSSWESPTLPGMFFAGTLMQARDFRKTMSAFIHGFRHNIVALDQILQARDGGPPWRLGGVVDGDPRALSDGVIARLSTSAAIMLQPGYMADLIGVDAHGVVHHWHDVPVDHAREQLAAAFDSMLLVTLEYKENDGTMNPFAMPRGLGVDEDYYLHPVLRFFRDGELCARGFLPDDLDNDWRQEPSHAAAVQNMLERHLTARAQSARRSS